MKLKNRIWQAILLGMVIWPFVHFELVQAYEISPWKLHGMAMYCVPKLRESVVIYRERAGRRLPVGELTSELATAIDSYLVSRRALGQLASLAEVERSALAYLATQPSPATTLVLEIKRFRIDSSSYRVMIDTFTRRFSLGSRPEELG